MKFLSINCIAILCLATVGSVQAQRFKLPKFKSVGDSNLYMINIDKQNLYYSLVIDKHSYEIMRDQKDNIVVFEMGVPIDTISDQGFSVYGPSSFYFLNKRIYFFGYNAKKQLGVFVYDLSRRNLSFSSSESSLHVLTYFMEGFYGRNLLADKAAIYRLNAKDNKIELIFSFKDMVSPRSKIAFIHNFETGRLLIVLGEQNSDGLDSPKYFILNLINKGVTDVTVKFKNLCWLENENNTGFEIFDFFAPIFPGYLFVEGNACKKVNRQCFLIDENVNVLEDSIMRIAVPHSGIYEGNNMVGMFVNTVLDDKRQRVLLMIPEVPDLTFVRLLKKVEDNGELTKEELSVLSSYSLTALENFIHAKHNYKFPDPYWEAYFNCFSFYSAYFFRDKLPRLSDVGSKLTERDKRSLKVIKEVSDSKK